MHTPLLKKFIARGRRIPLWVLEVSLFVAMTPTLLQVVSALERLSQA